jgi:hypothetical protein
VRQASLINRAAVKQLLLGLARAKWPGGHYGTRVAANVYEHIEAQVRNNCLQFVHHHPSVGKTLSTGERNAQET